MPGVPQTLPVPPLVNEMTMLNAIRLAAGAGGGGGGGATGDVVGPASSTDGAVSLWDGLTGKLLKDSSIFITGGGTVALGGFTLTVPVTGTAALLEVANIFTVNGAASTPAMSLTGAVFTGGTSTTTKPLFLIEPTGTTSTGWSTDGTMFGLNAPSGFVGNLADLQLNGASKFVVSYAGALRINGTSVGNTLAFRGDVGFLDINGFGGQSGTAIGGETYLPGINFGKNSAIRWTNDGTASSADVALSRATGGVLFLYDAGSGGATLQMAEQTAPAAPSADQVRIYAVDNGSGKTQLMALFSSGAAQQIAIQP